MTETPIPGFVAVVPAGGVGSRLWPLSRPERPKFLLDLLGAGTTMLQDTVQRLRPVAEDILIVTGERHRDAVRAQLPTLPADAILAEPTPRDSMAAIALAAAVIERRHGPRTMGSFAADHVIAVPRALRDAIRLAAAAAAEGMIATIGIEPTGPSTAFGYIEFGGRYAPGVSKARAFTEKPDAERARAMIDRGGFAWNAGMYVARTDVLLGHLERLQPTLHAGVRRIAEAWDGPDRAEIMDAAWPLLTKISIDHAIAEPVAAEGGVVVVPASFGWHDVGDFASLAEITPPDADGITRIACHGSVVAVDSLRPVVVGARKAVAVVGLDDVVVVETADALLVMHRSAAQRVKDVVPPSA